MKHRALHSLTAIMLAGFLLTGCAKVSEWMGDDALPPLKGERISILQLQKELAPNAELQKTPLAVPEAWTNKFWPQVGGYPTHTMGHLALGNNLKKVWSTKIGAGGDRRTPLTSIPVAAEGMVFALDTEGNVTAFDLAKGQKKWRQSVTPKGEEDSGAIGGGIAYAAGKLYVTNGYKQLVSLNPANGAMNWKAVVVSPVRAAPTVMDDKIYLMTMDNRLLVFSAVDGSPLWNYTGVSETTNLLGAAIPAVDQSVVVVPLSSGELFGLRTENGQVVWEDNLSAVRRAGTLSSIADIRGLPVVDQGIVYAVSYSGRMVAIDQVSGQRVWQREIGSAETPWSAGDSVFVISVEQQLIALARKNGDIHWITQLSRFADSHKEAPIVWTAPVLAGGRLILASSDGRMAEVNPVDGKILRTTKLAGDVTLPPIVVDNTLLVLTENGELSAYR